MIGHLGHFLLDFLAQIWTQGTLRHILGPILVIFAGSLEAAYSLNWGAREIWGKGGGETLALL